MSETTDTEEKAAQDVADGIRAQAHAAIAMDLPRMVRSDATRITEMISKYHAIVGAEGVVAYLLDARAALLSYSPGVAVEFTATGGGAEFLREGELADGAQKLLHPPQAEVKKEPPPSGAGVVEYDAGGRDVLVTTLLVGAGVLSSTARAKLALRDGIIRVGGAVVSHPGALLAPGKTYAISVGEDGEGWYGRIAVR